MEELILDSLEPAWTVVRAGNNRVFVLSEPGTDAHLKYSSRMAATTEIHQQGGEEMVHVSKGSARDAEVLLLSLCLYDAGTAVGIEVSDIELRKRVLNDKGDYDPAKLVPEAVIRGWRSAAFVKMLDRLVDISPGLQSRLTPDTIKKRIRILQAQLAAMEKNGTPEKNLP